MTERLIMLYCNTMTRTQKRVLAVFALIDVMVVLLLGYVIASSRTPINLNETEWASETCGARLIQELPHIPGHRTAVAYDQSLGELHITVYGSAPLSSDLDSAGAQSLWVVLSQMAPHASRACPSAKAIILAVETVTSSNSAFHVARFPAPVVSKWVNSELSDDQLAAGSGYRHVPAQTANPVSPHKPD